MRSLLLGTALGIIALATVAAAHAEPIQGQISFIGLNTYDTTTGDVSFLNPMGFGALYGSYANALYGSADGAMFSDFNYLHLVPGQLYTATSNHHTTTFALNSIDYVHTDLGGLTVDGSGIATLTGYDPTPGTFSFTTQADGLVSFSATVDNAVPEPASIGLMLTGLLGMVGWGAYQRRA